MNLNMVCEWLKVEEGLSLTLYKDSLGVPTIGFGTNISKIDGVEAEFLLQHRLLRASDDLERAFPWSSSLDDVRHAVLVDMTYNMGISALAEFHLTMAAVQAGDWAAASREMLGSLWARQVGPRAIRLAGMMLSGKEI